MVNKKQLMRKAIKKWGKPLQRTIAVEELSELIKALCKYEREMNNATHWGVVDEIVDVELCLIQLKLMFCQGALYKEHYNMKLERLQKRLGA